MNIKDKKSDTIISKVQFAIQEAVNSTAQTVQNRPVNSQFVNLSFTAIRSFFYINQCKSWKHVLSPSCEKCGSLKCVVCQTYPTNTVAYNSFIVRVFLFPVMMASYQ